MSSPLSESLPLTELLPLLDSEFVPEDRGPGHRQSTDPTSTVPKKVQYEIAVLVEVGPGRDSRNVHPYRESERSGKKSIYKVPTYSTLYRPTVEKTN